MSKMTEEYEASRERLRKLYDDCPSDDDGSDIDPFCDDGEFGDDPTYEPSICDSDEMSNMENPNIELNHSDRGDEISEIENDSEQEDLGEPIVDESGEEWMDDVKEIPHFSFDASSSGVQIEIQPDATPLQVFEQIFNPLILETLVESTNAYGKKLCEINRPATRNCRIAKFRPTDSEEMFKFLGLCMLQSQVKAPTIRSLFSNDPLYYHPLFPATMSGRRFEQLLRSFSCNVDSNDNGKLKKISPLLKLFIQSFQKAYRPEKELSLDESLLLFRGRLSFKQYIKGKKAKFGIKFYELTSSSGYVLNIEIYQGKNDVSTCPKVSSIVSRLMDPFLQKGHHVFMDNYYNSIELCNTLLSMKTHCTGTLRSNRRGNPVEVVSKKLTRGGFIWKRKGNVYVSKWKDKRDVLCITTAIHPKMIEVRNRHGTAFIKPEQIATYTKYMPGVDRSDQMVSYYSSPKKNIRWYKKVMFHLLDIATWNSYFLYKKTTGSNQSFLQFRDLLIKAMIRLPKTVTKGQDLVVINRPFHGGSRNTATNSAATSNHFMEKIPVPENRKRKAVYLRCKECAKTKIRKETSYRCKNCPSFPALCAGNCFEKFHAN